jgi:hypothetical protein
VPPSLGRSILIGTVSPFLQFPHSFQFPLQSLLLLRHLLFHRSLGFHCCIAGLDGSSFSLDGCLLPHDRNGQPAADAQDAGPEYQDASASDDDYQSRWCAGCLRRIGFR